MFCHRTSPDWDSTHINEPTESKSITVKPGYKHIGDKHILTNKHTILGPKAKFTVLYAPGYKHNLTYKHAIIGPECMLIARFYCTCMSCQGMV